MAIVKPFLVVYKTTMENGKKLIAGNWKMHGDAETATALAKAVASFSAGPPMAVEIVLCPPFPLIQVAAQAVAGSTVKLGGQDCHAEAEGAHTGDVSAPMLKSLGCTYVITGHSERRIHHRETSGDVGRKAAAAIAAGLVPIICVGETQAERDGGKAESVVAAQIGESLPKSCSKGNFVLAYEPVWAIGSGKTPTAHDIAAMHAHILSVAAKQTGLANGEISVLYGGSVKAANAKEILSIEGVGGVLVGGASLKAEEFCKIIAST